MAMTMKMDKRTFAHPAAFRIDEENFQQLDFNKFSVGNNYGIAHFAIPIDVPRCEIGHQRTGIVTPKCPAWHRRFYSAGASAQWPAASNSTSA